MVEKAYNAMYDIELFKTILNVVEEKFEELIKD